MSVKDEYLTWLGRETPTRWWHDSADPGELERALALGATGVTTNPLLSYQALRAAPDAWAAALAAVSADMDKDERAESLVGAVVTGAAERVVPVFERTGGADGYACAQVNPSQAGDRSAMLAMARRYAGLAPNVTVKLPATAAGLDVLEECIAEGTSCTVTVSFTVPQVIATAERYAAGARRAEAAGRAVPPCFAVIMIGRLDDYLREVALDRCAEVTEADIRQAGLAVTKRAYRLYRQRARGPRLLVAALRGPYHMTGLAGADITMSIHPKIQEVLAAADPPREPGIEADVAPDVMERLLTLPDFVRAYEPDGMRPEDFLSYGLTQRTLSQFVESGWALLGAMGGP